jgi:2'-5' RNA ligase
MHLTLKFLGDIAQAQVEPILTALRATLSNLSSFSVQASGLGAFPNLRRPKVLWAGLHGEGLVGLQEKVESALVALDFSREERDFTPHLTLGRVRSLRGWEQVLAVVKKHEQVQFGESLVDRVTLYQSTLRPDGAVYSPLGTVPLQQM